MTLRERNRLFEHLWPGHGLTEGGPNHRQVGEYPIGTARLYACACGWLGWMRPGLAPDLIPTTNDQHGDEPMRLRLSIEIPDAWMTPDKIPALVHEGYQMRVGIGPTATFGQHNGGMFYVSANVTDADTLGPAAIIQAQAIPDDGRPMVAATATTPTVREQWLSGTPLAEALDIAQHHATLVATGIREQDIARAKVALHHITELRAAAAPKFSPYALCKCGGTYDHHRPEAFSEMEDPPRDLSVALPKNYDGAGGYHLIRWEKSEGCDYSIGCGVAVTALEAGTRAGAMLEAKRLIFGPEPEEYDGDGDEHRLKRAVLVTFSEEIPIAEWYAEVERTAEINSRQSKENHERKELARLMAKYGASG